MNRTEKLRTGTTLQAGNDSGRSAEPFIAGNSEMFFHNSKKEKRAEELLIANKELLKQNREKERRALELIIANEELAFQNLERKKRTSELLLANKELAFQIQEKEKREAELLRLNKELLVFNYISSHHLQEPLRKIQIFANKILATEQQDLSEQGINYFQRMQSLSGKMQQMIIDLLAYSAINTTERCFETTDLNKVAEDIKHELRENIGQKQAIIHVEAGTSLYVMPLQFRQLLYNLISNALKFSNPQNFPYILIKSAIVTASGKENTLLKGKKYVHLTVEDNGMGFEPEYSERIFGVFQKLHTQEQYPGTGIGLAMVKKIVENHEGKVFATGKLNEGACFDIYIPLK